MSIKELSKIYLNWEDDNQLFNLKSNSFPIYALLRMQLYHSFLFGNDVVEEFTKDSLDKVKKISITKVLINSLSFFFSFWKLKKDILIFSNSANRKKTGSVYKDILFDNIRDEQCEKSVILEFPQIGTYHYKNSYHQQHIVKGDFFYALEKIFKSKLNIEEIQEIISFITKEYLSLWEKVHETKINSEALNNQMILKSKRNLSRIVIYKNLLKLFKPKHIYLKAGYVPQSQIIIFIAKQLKINVVEMQHGHIYSLHGGYVYPKNSNLGLFPDKIAVWSKYYEGILFKNGWSYDRIKVLGDYTELEKLNDSLSSQTMNTTLMKIKNNHEHVITIVSQHSIEYVFVNFLKKLQNLDKNLGVILKLHPRLQEKQTSFFEKELTQLDNLFFISNVDIKECFFISDLIIGVYSTVMIEAIEAGVPVHLIDCHESELLCDLVDEDLVVLSSDIDKSYDLIKSVPNKVKEYKFRDKFDKLSVIELL